jgi:hypothetical protein
MILPLYGQISLYEQMLRFVCALSYSQYYSHVLILLLYV